MFKFECQLFGRIKNDVIAFLSNRTVREVTPRIIANVWINFFCWLSISWNHAISKFTSLPTFLPLYFVALFAGILNLARSFSWDYFGSEKINFNFNFHLGVSHNHEQPSQLTYEVTCFWNLQIKKRYSRLISTWEISLFIAVSFLCLSTSLTVIALYWYSKQSFKRLFSIWTVSCTVLLSFLLHYLKGEIQLLEIASRSW